MCDSRAISSRGVLAAAKTSVVRTNEDRGSYQRTSAAIDSQRSHLDAPSEANLFVAGPRNKKAAGRNARRFAVREDAMFSARAESLEDVKTLHQYTEWVKGPLAIMPDGTYELKSLGADEGWNSVCAYAVFSGAHTGEGGRCPPTGKSVTSDYVYITDFEGDKIRHMTKVWHSGLAMK